MNQDRLALGIFTTDARLVVRTWDAWMAAATGIDAADALHRPLVEVVPEITARDFVSILHSVLTRGTVEVLSAALHHYLFACAPSEPSPMFDHMQQHVTIGPLRDDGQLIGLIVTVEDVTARIERERNLADSQLHDAPSIESLTRLLGEDDWRTRRVAVTTLAQRGNAVVDAVVRTIRIQHDNLNVLSSALDLLAMMDIDVVEPLITYLEDDDADLRTQAALILGERLDRRAITPLIARLSDPDVNVAFHAIEALGRLHASEASEPLVELALRRDFFLSFPAIHALSHLGSASVAPRLVPLLEDELLRSAVVEALGELGDEDVTPALVQLLDSPTAPTEVITGALAGLYDRYETRYGAGEHIAAIVRRRISATATQRILDTVHRIGSDRLAGLAKVLGWLDGDAVRRALTRLLGQGSVRSQIVEALVRNGSSVVQLLIEQLGAEDLETRQAAAVALGRIGDRRATLALVTALADAEVTVEAAGALARIGDADAFEPLLQYLSSADAAVRQAVVAALNSIGHSEMPQRIVGLMSDTSPATREAALRIAGYFGYPACLDAVLACCRDGIEAVRRTAVEQLAFFEDDRAVEPLVNGLQDVAPSVRAAAAAGLRRIEHPVRFDALIAATTDADAWVRYVAIKSLAAIGDSGAVPTIVARLQMDVAPHVRLAAIEAIGRLAPPQALTILEPLTQSSIQDIARGAIVAIGHVQQPEALARLELLTRAGESWQRLAALEALALRRESELIEPLQWVAATDADSAVVETAFDVLARIGRREGRQGDEATRALVRLASEPSRLQATISALSSLPTRRIDDIAAGLRDASPTVRCAIVEALSRMKQPEASRALEAALDDDAPTVRLAAVAELNFLGSRTSQRKLMTLARTDPDAGVRHAALRAVARAEGGGSSATVDSGGA